MHAANSTQSAAFMKSLIGFIIVNSFYGAEPVTGHLQFKPVVFLNRIRGTTLDQPGYLTMKRKGVDTKK